MKKIYEITNDDNIVLAEDISFISLHVEAKTQDGVDVVGQTVFVHNGADETAPIAFSAAYDGVPISINVNRGMQYFVRISDTLAGHFNPTTATGFANSDVSVEIVYSDVNSVRELTDIAPVLAAIGSVEVARSILVGKVFDDVWVDYDATGSGDSVPAQIENHPAWNDPLVISDVREVEDANGVRHIGAVLMRKYCSRYDIVFDAANKELASEETAQAGITYYGFAPAYDPEKTYAKNACVKVGDVIYYATAAITTKEDWTPSHWATTTEPKDGASIELLSISEGSEIPYGSYDRIYKNSVRDNTKNVILYGHNHYGDSAIRQYLNSSSPKNEWWERKHAGQIKPTSASSYSGYKRGCSALLLSLIKPTKQDVFANTVCDGGVQYSICDDFFLPSCREMFGIGNNVDEGDFQYDYWRDLLDNETASPADSNATINAVRKMVRINTKSSTSASTVRLRSAYRENSYCAWYVIASGSLNSRFGNASSAYAVAPACVIY